MQTNLGVLYAVLAFFLWGILPVYWREFAHISAGEIIANRVIWTSITTAIFIIFGRNFARLSSVIFNRKNFLSLFLSAFLIGSNWLLFIWAVNNGYVLEASLGYYINPLLNVFLAVLVLKEKLSRRAAFAVFLAFVAVFYLSLTYGHVPWIALYLASTFAVYGLIRKTSKIGSVQSLTLETMLMLPFAAGFMCWKFMSGTMASFEASPYVQVLLVSSGLITAAPLILFTEAARRINFSTLGIIQYLGPTMHFILAVYIYKEPFNQHQLFAFVIIWIALIVYSLDSYNNYKRAKVTVTELV